MLEKLAGNTTSCTPAGRQTAFVSISTEMEMVRDSTGLFKTVIRWHSHYRDCYTQGDSASSFAFEPLWALVMKHSSLKPFVLSRSRFPRSGSIASIVEAAVPRTAEGPVSRRARGKAQALRFLL